MQTALLAVHVITTITLVVLILIQRGKGADIGASFGGGASQTVFGSQGSASFLTRTTAVLATLFFVTSLTLAYFSTQGTQHESVTDMVMPASVVEPLSTETDFRTDVPLMPSQEMPGTVVDDLPPVLPESSFDESLVAPQVEQ